ncbi:MAG: hypothetical protein IPJ13_30630 [Saprospiraceae bacterium]|nr:hypothetical protein [Saprospiraceae bacterium]
MRDIKFRMWNNVKDNPKASKMFYEIYQVMDCLKQQLYYDNQVMGRLGYDHIGGKHPTNPVLPTFGIGGTFAKKQVRCDTTKNK